MGSSYFYHLRTYSKLSMIWLIISNQENKKKIMVIKSRPNILFSIVTSALAFLYSLLISLSFSLYHELNLNYQEMNRLMELKAHNCLLTDRLLLIWILFRRIKWQFALSSIKTYLLID